MDLPGKHSCNRLFEWFAARALLFFGLWNIFVGSLDASRFNPHLMLFGPEVLLALCVVVGGARSIVLWLNGDLERRGPTLRFLLSLFSIALWAQLLIALLSWRNPSASIPFYFWLLYAEIQTCARAARDSNGLAARA